MNPSNWEEWATRTLQRGNLSEPPEHVLKRAYAICTGRRTLPGWLAAAALLTVTVTGGILLTQRRAPALPTVPLDSTVRSGEVTLIEPVGTLERMPSVFSWNGVDDAVSYRLRILAVDDAVLFEQTTDGTSIALPDTAAVTLHAAVTYTWQVDALDADGALLARSQPTRFEIQP